MNRYTVAFYALGGVIGGVVGFLAGQAGYALWGRCGWVAVVILLALVYGWAGEQSREARERARRR